jgi:hypothetical protein
MLGTGWKGYAGSAAVFLAGLACALQHVAAGDLAGHWQECLAIIGGGVAAFGIRDAIGRQP